MTETDFIAAFESDFPFDDVERARSLIQQAVGCSSNAAFYIALKLVRPPQERRVAVTRRVELLSILRAQLKHPLASLVLGIAERIIYGQRLHPDEVCRHIYDVAAFAGEYAALNIVYLSSEEANEIVNTMYDMTISGWQTDAKLEAAFGMEP
jgi:hypothetical protein